jgi:hypothetical protein
MLLCMSVSRCTAWRYTYTVLSIGTAADVQSCARIHCVVLRTYVVKLILLLASTVSFCNQLFYTASSDFVVACSTMHD